MAPFATDEWLAGVARRLASMVPALDPPVSVELIVSDPAEGERARWQLILGAARAEIVSAPSAPATLTLRCDRSTAIELAAARLNAQAAIAAGRLTVTGDINRTAAIAEQLLRASRAISGASSVESDA